jgi:predicted metal-binding transcription factor (methanogenesis marker protein 9)
LPAQLHVPTTESNAKIKSSRYNFSNTSHVRFLYFVTICFTLLIMACVISFIAWMVDRINKIIALRDEEIRRLSEKVNERRTNSQKSDYSLSHISKREVQIEMADIKNRDLVTGAQSARNRGARSVDRYAKFDDEINISDKDYGKPQVFSDNREKSTTH